MPQETIERCPSCGAKNRAPQAGPVRCGRCGATFTLAAAQPTPTAPHSGGPAQAAATSRPLSTPISQAGTGFGAPSGRQASGTQGPQAMKWYFAVLKNYAGFAGRAHRTEYWMFQLWNVVAYVVLGLLIVVLGTFGTVLGVLYYFGTLLPAFAVASRRLHDSGRTAGWLFISLIPFIGGLVLIIFLCLKSDAGPNRYGPRPAANSD